MSTNAYAAKRAILARLQEHAATGLLRGLGWMGAPVQVLYALRPADLEQVSIYGANVAFERDVDRYLQDGDNIVWPETARTAWIVRVAATGDGTQTVADLDDRAEAIGEVLQQILASEPGIAGGHSWSYIVSGQGEYSWDPEAEVSNLAYEIRTQSQLVQQAH